MKNLLHFKSISLFLVMALVPALPAFAQQPRNLSGYEFRLGTPCTIENQAGKCGVSFGGWTGGKGQQADGWTPFPGNRQGMWQATVNYIGAPNFNDSVTLYSGSFDLYLKHHLPVSGTITGGTVQWPTEEGDYGCGTGVAKVTVYLTIKNTNQEIDGCLHDLPAGAIIPPTIWGTLQ